MSEFLWGVTLGLVLGVFHVPLWAFVKPLAIEGWAKFQAWRAKP